MFTRAHFLGAVMAVVHCCRSPVYCENDISPLPEQIATAKSALEHKRIVGGYLRERSIKELRRLATGDNDGLAIQAYWSIVRRSGARLVERAGVAAGGRSVVPRLDLARFVGFVEGRLHIGVPEWWNSVVMRSHFSADDWVMFTPGRSRARYEEVGDRRLGSSPIRVVAQRGEDVRIVLQDREVTVPHHRLQEFGGVDAAEVITHGASSQGDYIAFHNSTAASYILLLVDRKTGAVRWSTSVWAG